MRKTLLCSLTIISLSVPALSGVYDSLFVLLYRNVEFLPGYYLQADINTFALHKSAYFKRQYLAEGIPRIEFEFLSYRNIVHSVWDIQFDIGMGQVPGNVVFSVLDVTFDLTPTIEVTLPRLMLHTGLHHRCVHEVDRQDYAVVFWNHFFVGAGTPNTRLRDFWTPLATDDGWTVRNRLAFYGRAGHYLREFFGLASPSKLNGQNGNLFDVELDARFAVYRRRSWIIAVNGASLVGGAEEQPGITSRGGAYWRQTLAAEAYFRRGAQGARFRLAYILDDIPETHGRPRFSKDQLLQISVSFFN